jgi:hypothetical protein
MSTTVAYPRLLQVSGSGPPRHQVYPAISSLTFQTSSAPGRAEARYLLVSNSYYEPSRDTLCCHAPVTIPPFRELCKYYTTTGAYCTLYFGLCCGMLLRIARAAY